jgi:hypothetical protein
MRDSQPLVVSINVLKGRRTADLDAGCAKCLANLLGGLRIL